MNPSEFVNKYYPFALEVERRASIPAIAIMAQAALESGWGKKAIGNNIFGIKFRKGDYGYQKVLTTEYHKSPEAFKGAEIKSIVYIPGRKKYKYKIWQYFADYKSPVDCFNKHAALLLTKRYKHALRWKHSPKRYLIAVGKSGYSTSSRYGRTMCDMVDSITRRL